MYVSLGVHASHERRPSMTRVILIGDMHRIGRGFYIYVDLMDPANHPSRNQGLAPLRDPRCKGWHPKGVVCVLGVRVTSPAHVQHILQHLPGNSATRLALLSLMFELELMETELVKQIHDTFQKHISGSFSGTSLVIPGTFQAHI